MKKQKSNINFAEFVSLKCSLTLRHLIDNCLSLDEKLSRAEVKTLLPMTKSTFLYFQVFHSIFLLRNDSGVSKTSLP